MLFKRFINGRFSYILYANYQILLILKIYKLFNLPCIFLLLNLFLFVMGPKQLLISIRANGNG